MFRLSALLLLFSYYYILPLTATVLLSDGKRNRYQSGVTVRDLETNRYQSSVTVRDLSTNCYQPGYNVLSKRKLMDCYAALDLLPNTSFKVDPHQMAVDYQGSGSPRPCIRLTGKETYRINGDKICLPAAFQAGRCVIRILTIAGAPPPPEDVASALLLHLYFWPHVRKTARVLTDECLKREQSWVLMHSKMVASNWSYPFMISVKIGEEEVLKKFGMEKVNVYTQDGQLNDVRWRVPFQRPTEDSYTGKRDCIGS